MSTSTRVPAGVTTGGQFAASPRDEAAVDLADVSAATRDGEVDARERAAQREAIVAESLHADGEGIGYRFEVEGLADAVAHAVEPDSTGARREQLRQSARETIALAVAGGRASACTGEPGPLQHWSDEADSILDEALEAAWSARGARVPGGASPGPRFTAAERGEADDVELVAEPEAWEPSEGVVVGGDGYGSHGDCDPDDATPGFFPEDDNDCWICGDPLE